MRALTCGSRDWTDGALILRELRALHAERGVEVVIHGAAPGADTFAGEAATALRVPVESFPADWDRHGRAAGPLRNQRMLDKGRPDLVLAFSEDLNSSRGTADMVARALAADGQVRLVSHQDARELPPVRERAGALLTPRAR